MSTAFVLAFVALWGLVILNSLVLLGIVRIVHRLQQESIGTAQGWIGRKAPPFQVEDLSGAPVGTNSFDGRVRALLFVSPSCRSCVASLEELDLLRRKAEGNVIVICQATHAECARLAATSQLDGHVVADEDKRIGKLFDVSALPTAVLISDDNRIQSYGEPLREDDPEDSLGQTTSARAAEVA